MIITVTFKPAVASNRSNGFTNTQQHFTPECYKFHAKKWKDVKRGLKKISAIRSLGAVDVGATTQAKTQATPLMTIAQLCNYLKISERTCRRWRADGKLPFKKQGRTIRFDRSAVDSALQAQGYKLTNNSENMLTSKK
ncbi:MAG: Helix-turn-helix domain [Mucilaginibacter sp.]|uniref:helix-turn-helix domain-containing protein n=1 Tax=Mucilaginibacter sp. TaxID=1882438 RepID=UPI0026342202|nr:helix-turn-helix domain-containing protein [Mucilaginibacter sp.]MDB5003877.1 Helix-turn-helix domain [Mucilaginibacter sp.]